MMWESRADYFMEGDHRGSQDTVLLRGLGCRLLLRRCEAWVSLDLARCYPGNQAT